jgi:hypothetical protein
METGLLWFDDDAKTGFEEKVRQAARRYEEKHGQRPNTCFVHATALDGKGVMQVGEVTVRPSATVLVHHFWIGVHNNNEEEVSE